LRLEIKDGIKGNDISCNAIGILIREVKRNCIDITIVTHGGKIFFWEVVF
jgi:hypothetical protein